MRFIATSVPILILVTTFLQSGRSQVLAQNPTDSINATVRLSVCGNGEADTSEDCDDHDLRTKNCVKLGYQSGPLKCDIACSFDTSSCNVPDIDPEDVPPGKLVSLLAAGHFGIPETASIIATPSVRTTHLVVLKIPAYGEATAINKVKLPHNVVISRADEENFDPTDLTASSISISSLSGISSYGTAKASLQWGLNGTTLEFDTPITLDIFVGTLLDNQTLNVIRSTSLDSGWTDNGIVAPATCVVSQGICTFQATKASYFAVLTPVSTPSSSSSTSSTTSTSSTSSSSGSSFVPTPQTIIYDSKPGLPEALRYFDIRGLGKLTLPDLATIVKIWVEEWKGVKFGKTNNKCDFDRNDFCDIKDFSILLYYVER